MKPERDLPASSGPGGCPPPLLRVSSLRVAIRGQGGDVEAVCGLSFTIDRGETLGIVGESGSGKTLTALSVMGLLPNLARITAGHILLESEDLRAIPGQRYRELRRRRMGYIPQDPHAALHPSIRIRPQIIEGLARTRGERRAFEDRAVDLLKKMGLSDVEHVLDRYSYELSGGMKQRIMAAIALIRDPVLIVADEPTSALDVTVQAQFVGQLKELQAMTGVSMLFISHDLGVISSVCDMIAVMYAGEIVEYGPAERVTEQPKHPYTQGLLASMPSIADGTGQPQSIPGRPLRPGEATVGCKFVARCQFAHDRCGHAAPPAVFLGEGKGFAACWLLTVR